MDKKPWIIYAERSALSAFGAKTMPTRDADGKIMRFATEEEARAEADKLNQQKTTPSVNYRPGLSTLKTSAFAEERARQI